MAVTDTKHGVRLSLEKRQGEGPLAYVGTVSEDADQYPLELVIDASNAVTASPTGAEHAVPKDLGERAARIVRTALKQAQSQGLPPPRRITRWRPGR